MLFLLKRTWPGGLAGLAVLLLLAFGLRGLLAGGTPLTVNLPSAGLGVAVCAGIVVSDGIVHGVLSWLTGSAYRERFRELVGIFRHQTPGAMAAGSLMAGLGEEPLFRGLGTDPLVLAGLAVLFGILHHIRRPLWPFTLWAIFEGLLFAAAVYWTANLFVTMTAHFGHDLIGFLIFRRESGRFLTPPVPEPAGP